MTDKPIDWTPDLTMPTSKSTVQHFIATADGDRLEIDTTPWGEGDLTVNGRSIAHLAAAPGGAEAFRALETIAEEFEAAKAADRDWRLAQIIEDDEVRQTLCVTRGL